MANESRTQLKTYFQTGDIPTQAQFENLIDSSPNKVDDGIPPILVMAVSQPGASNLPPEITTFQNTTGETFSFTRPMTGTYVMTNPIINARTWICGATAYLNNTGATLIPIWDRAGTVSGYFGIYNKPDESAIYLECISADLVTPRDLSDFIGADTFFLPEIRFYP